MFQALKVCVNYILLYENLLITYGNTVLLILNIHDVIIIKTNYKSDIL